MPQRTGMVSWPVAVLIVLGTAMLAVSPVVATTALIACALAALVGPAWALQALTLATLIAYANPAIIKSGPMTSVLLRIVLLVVILRFVPTMRRSDLRLVWPIWLFGLLSALTSTVQSPVLSISIMKVLTFTLASSSVLIALGHLSAERLQRMQTWFLTVGLTIIFMSALTLLKPGLGTGLDGGLQGVLGQPQALGIFIAPFAAWSVAGVLLMRRRASRLELCVAIGTVVLVLLTRARTAAFATIFAVGVVVLTRMLARRRVQQASLGRPLLVMSIVAVVVTGLALATGEVSRFVTHFAYKGTEKETHNLGSAFYESRGGGVLAEWRHFQDSPLLGNGFGVYPDGKFPSGVVEFAGIPISAPVEKGFLPTAILEEGGIVGAGSLAFLIVWLGRYAWRSNDLRWRAMFIGCLAINIGECVLLSPGGIGILDWLLMGIALTAWRAQLHTAPRLPNRAPQPSLPGGGDVRDLSLPAA